MLATEPTDRTQASEPAEPMDKIEPAEPTDKMDPLDPMDRIDPLEPMLRIDPDEPAEREEALLIPMGPLCRNGEQRFRPRGGIARSGTRGLAGPLRRRDGHRRLRRAADRKPR